MKSSVNFIFNAHLPFVRHPEFSRFLEEDWLFEAMNESYIPLLRMMFRLKEDKVKFKLTFALSATLCCMLTDSSLQEKFIKYVENKIELGNLEVKRLANDENNRKIAQMYLEILNCNLEFYKKFNGNILDAFFLLSKEGYIELAGGPATHAYLPLYKDFPVAVNAQIETGIQEHLRYFENPCDGFWLPECGYYPGLDKLLRRNGVKWVSLANSSFFLSNTVPEDGIYAPVKTKDGLYCFARDYYLTSLVWSSETGYPVNENYREFYRDIGYDEDLEYIRSYIHEPDVRVFTGFKYWSITGNTPDKKLYNYDIAYKTAQHHAEDFVGEVEKLDSKISSYIKNTPVHTLSFDAELFGHRWFEGIAWLEKVIRLMSDSLSTPSAYLSKTENTKVQILEPGFSSWAEGSFSQMWTDNNSNAWLLKHNFRAVDYMQTLAHKFPDLDSLKLRFINQCARETLLSMASDWPVILYNNTSSEYAKKRVISHLQNVEFAYEYLMKNAISTTWLINTEKTDNIFPTVNYKIFDKDYLNKDPDIFTKEI